MAEQRKASVPYGKRMKRKKFIGGLDVPFFSIVIILLTIGVASLLSASYVFCASSPRCNYDSYFYFKRQLFFASFGVFVMCVISNIDYHKFKNKRLIRIGLIVTILLLLVAFLTGSGEFKRWIRIGPISFQPSELAKFMLVIYLATDISENWPMITGNGIIKNDRRPSASGQGLTLANGMKESTYMAFKYMIVIGTLAVLVALGNHISGAAIILILGMIMMYLGGFSRKMFRLLLFLGVVLVALVLFKPTILPDNAAKRIIIWKYMNGIGTLPESYTAEMIRDQRWQTDNSICAMGSGRFFGVGIGKSRMKHLYISEPQNDFIFPVVCEEIGFFGASLIVALFIFLVKRGAEIGKNADDMFGSLLATGFIYHIGMQIILNLCVVTDVMPNTGISLPFFSYGGTAIIMMLAEMGVILSVSRMAHMKKDGLPVRKKKGKEKNR